MRANVNDCYTVIYGEGRNKHRLITEGSIDLLRHLIHFIPPFLRGGEENRLIIIGYHGSI